jgi:hypothetical protein
MSHCLVNHHITGHLVFVPVCLYRVSMMCPVVDNPASCEVHTVLCFHHTESMSAAGIHRELHVAV